MSTLLQKELARCLLAMALAEERAGREAKVADFTPAELAWLAAFRRGVDA